MVPEYRDEDRRSLDFHTTVVESHLHDELEEALLIEASLAVALLLVLQVDQSNDLHDVLSSQVSQSLDHQEVGQEGEDLTEGHHGLLLGVLHILERVHLLLAV